MGTVFSYIDRFLNALFPLSTDERYLARLTDEDFLSLVRPVPIPDGLALAPFEEAAVSAAIRLAKFRNHHRATDLLGTLLARHLARYTADSLLIPLPISQARFRKRGYNQTEKIAKAAHQQGGEFKLANNLLIRRRNDRPQTSLKREERLKNVQGAFALKNRKAAEIINGRTIILLDDVTTTGATLKAASEAIREARPASLVCLAIAH